MKLFKFLFIVLLVSVQSHSQKAQRIAYLDMEYILAGIPEYVEAQKTLDTKATSWQQNLDKLRRDIEVLKEKLSNERVLLTKDLIIEKEEEISIKTQELKQKQIGYFGANGDLFLLRKQLVKPVQDQIFNSVQDIAKIKKYDMVLNKTGELVMLYTNPKYNISDDIIRIVTRDRKKKEIKDKKIEKAIEKTDRMKDLELKTKEREAFKKTKREEMLAKIKAQKEDREKKRLEARAAIELKRKEREAAREKKVIDQKESINKQP